MARAAAFAFLVFFAFILPSCGGSDSNPAAPQAPTVSFTAPAGGATVQGTVTLSATAARAERVRFLVNGGEVASDAEEPYSFVWNSATVVDGVHALKAVADGAGGTAEDEITVTVQNGTVGGTVQISVAPAVASVQVNGTVQFAANVTGTANTAVSWSVTGGATNGAISTAGLYTAPNAVPNPATVTVRATSQADPAESATASVTITAAPPAGIPQTALQQAFTAGTDASLTADALVNGAAEVVFAASIANGGVLTLTGTVTESAGAPNGFTYAADPNDRMVIQFADGTRVEAVFAAFEGFFDGTYEDFVDSHSNLDFTVVVAGQVNLHIRSASGPASSPTRGAGLSPAAATSFERAISGTYAANGETVTVNLTHAGNRNFEVDGQFLDYLSEEGTIGTIAAPSGQITVNEGYRYTLVRFDNFVENVTRASLSKVVVGGETYEFVDGFVRKAYRNNLVTDTDFWVARGSLLKNGAPVAQIRFNGPVIAGAAFPGPRAELAFGTGEVVPLAVSPLGELAKTFGRARMLP